MVVGFPFTARARLVESVGTAVRPDATLTLHRADTASGHSGAPGLIGGAVAGVHIGGFSINPFKGQHPRHNVALALQPSLDAIIARGVASWG